MHGAARRFVTRVVRDHGPFEHVVEIGSRDINGSIRTLFDGAHTYVGIDLYEGPSVDWAGDAAEFKPEQAPDCVVCCEVLEHAPDWPGLIHVAAGWLAPGGCLIVTCAGPGRPEHSGIDGRKVLRDGEHYGNVSRQDLLHALVQSGLRGDAQQRGLDTQALAWKR